MDGWMTGAGAFLNKSTWHLLGDSFLILSLLDDRFVPGCLFRFVSLERLMKKAVVQELVSSFEERYWKSET